MQQTVLLIHSGGFTSRQWRRLAAMLSPDFNVLAPDLLGYGAERWPDGEPFHFRQDLAYLESMLDGGSAAHLVGHSYGGLLALQIALRRPDLVRSLALYDPVAFGILDDGDVADAEARKVLDLVPDQWNRDESGADQAWLRGFVEWWNGDGAWDRMGDDAKNAFLSTGWKVFQEARSLIADRTSFAAWSTISVPSLILGGAESPRAERRVVERLGEALPHSTVRFFDGVGHMGPISHAAIVNEAIADHIRQASAEK
jgi:pimeloyl-ACP methyl ester carboxylesterase